MNVRKSWLFTPGTRPDRFDRSSEAGADVLIMDLEDSVAPSDKAKAREAVIQALAAPGQASMRAVRINALPTSEALADLVALLSSGRFPDFLIVPKCEEPASLCLLDAWLTQAGASTRLVALVETAAGIERAGILTSATRRLDAVMLGGADLAADYACEIDAPNMDYARSRLIAAIAGSDIEAIDSPWFDLHDDVGRRDDLARSLRSGFTGKAAIHPNHIAGISAAFTPSAEAIEHARAVLAINTAGVGQLNGAMVDEAVARRARRTLASASASPSL